MKKPEDTGLQFIKGAPGHPLFGIHSLEDDPGTILYFTDYAAADAVTTEADIEAALNLAGAWSDLSWDEVEEGLDRIRHER